MNSIHYLDIIPPFLPEIFSRSVKGALLVVLIFVLRRLLKNRMAPAWRHAFWLLVPLLLFWPKFPASVCSLDNWSDPPREYVSREFSRQVVPLFSPDSHDAFSHQHVEPDISDPPALSSDTTNDHAITAVLDAILVAESEKTTHDVLPATNNTAVKKPVSLPVIPWKMLLFGLWCIGLILLLTRIVWQTLIFRRIIAASQHVTQPHILEILADVKTRLGIRHNLLLCESPQIAGPTLCGLWRPRIVFPAGFVNTVDDMQLGHILLHELAHWKRGDLWTGWLAAMTVAIHWFNPMIWLAARKASGDREEASDALVLATLGHAERADYGETLLMLSAQLANSRTIRFVPGAAGIMETRSLLTRRIEMITSHKHFTLWAKLACFGFIGLVAAVLFTSAIKRDPGEKLFGIIPLPKKETPNNASVTFENIPKRNQGLPREMKITIRGKFQTPNGEPFEKGTQCSGHDLGDSYSSSIYSAVGEDGAFSFQVSGTSNITLFLEDKSEQWAAPPYSFDTFDFDGDEMAVTIPVNHPVQIVGHVRDKETGEPLPGVRLAYIPVYSGLQRGRTLWTITTDSDGIFRKAVSTGEYMFVINSADTMYLSNEWGTPDDKAVFGRTVVIDDLATPTIELTYELPKLFTGRLLNPDGTPAKNQSVAIKIPENESNHRMGTSTNDDGIFHLYQTPQNVVLTVNSPDPNPNAERRFRLHRWIENELIENPQDVMEFQLLEPATIRARFINAKTGEPFSQFSVSSFRWNKPGSVNIRNHSWGFNPEKTDVPGEWIFASATPGVEYRFSGNFPGIHRHQDMLVASAAESGQYLDLGDVLIDDEPMPTTSNVRLPQLPLRVFDLSGKETLPFELCMTELYSGGATGRSVSTYTKDDSPLYAGYYDERSTRFYAIRDLKNRWATKPVRIAMPDEWEKLAEVRFDAVQGEMIRGTVRDESSGKPIANMPLTLVQKLPPQDDTPYSSQYRTLEWKLTTDSQGGFAVRMPPGEYGLGVNDTYGKYGNQLAGHREKELWTRTFSLEEGQPVALELRIPAPFIGKVLTKAGKPAGKVRVNYSPIIGNNFNFDVDDNGEFRMCEAPQPYSFFSLEWTYYDEAWTKQRLIRWIEPGETLAGKTLEFHLSDIDAVGRLFDATTGNPVPYPPGMQIYVAAQHASGSGRYKPASYYLQETSDKDGKFRIPGLTPGVRYTFRFGGPDSENGAIVIPGETGNLIDLGDIVVER